jgi:hypothetical protein
MPETSAPPIDAYRPYAPFYDELLEPDGVPRRAAAPLVTDNLNALRVRRRAAGQGRLPRLLTATLAAAVTMSRLDPQAGARA